MDDHALKNDVYRILNAQNGQLVEKEVPMLNALNEVLAMITSRIALEV
jgi:benzoyl-CoA 2,3-dioxygenase component B